MPAVNRDVLEGACVEARHHQACAGPCQPVGTATALLPNTFHLAAGEPQHLGGRVVDEVENIADEDGSFRELQVSRDNLQG